MHIKKFTILIPLIFLTITSVFSQEKDTLKTDVINVVKPYKPSISDAFKVKEKPTINDDISGDKKEIKYNIFSFPVASTFAPEKAKPAKVEKTEKENLFDNYASLGLGNYGTILGDLYLNKAISQNQNIGLSLGHHSSQGGINNLLVDDKFQNSKAYLDYAMRTNTYTLNLGGGFQFQTYNWYGIPQPEFNAEMLEGFNTNVKHSYATGNLDANINFGNGMFKSGSLLFRHFGDSFESAENRILAKATAEIPINDIDFLTTIHTDFLKGNFARDYYGYELPLTFKNIQFGVSPSFKIIKEELSLNLGAMGVFSNSTGDKKNALFFYPNVDASYRVLGDAVIAHGYAKGELVQNSYHGFVTNNVYVSPNLYIQPTNQLLNAFAGVKGIVENMVSYDLGVGLKTEKRKPLFKNNLITYGVNTEEGYHLGNSFGIVYDNVTTMSLLGKLNIDFERNFTLSIKGEYFNYNTKNETEAWNLPNIKTDVFLDYQINKQWYAGANVFYVGERKAYTGIQYVPELIEESITRIDEIVTLKSFIDANINVGYHINDYFSAYIKANNILGKNYQQWIHVPVQGFQALIGATYKFNF